MEALRAELARAKEQARRSDAAASKAVEELKAEKAAHCRSREEMAGMAVKLKDVTDRYEVLEKERRAEQEDLKKATAEAKDARSALRAIKEELRQAGDIAAGKPFLLRRKFTDPKYVLGNIVISKNFLRTRKIMVMHSNERGECCLRTLVDRSGSVDAT